MSAYEWVIEWIADDRGNVLRIDGDSAIASYRWVLREHILTPSEAMT